MSGFLISLSDVRCQYGSAAPVVLPDIQLAHGQHTLLLGPSGSGKSTLLNALAGIHAVSHGSIVIDGTPMSGTAAHARDQLRARKIGLVMQRLHLLSALTVRDNLTLAQKLAGRDVDLAHISVLMAGLNIAGKLVRYPQLLSQGEAQRVAIARALVNKPALVLADEPTSALDDGNANAVITLLLEQAAQYQATLLVATHDARIRPHFSNVITLGAA